jgi:hypothetical protein
VHVLENFRYQISRPPFFLLPPDRKYPPIAFFFCILFIVIIIIIYFIFSFHFLDVVVACRTDLAAPPPRDTK